MGWTISFAPVLGWPLIAVLAAIGLCLMAVSAYARARGWPLRSLALALLLLALANPSIRNEQREALSDIAVAVIDRSLSQQGGNRPGQTDAAEAALRSAVQRLGNTELRVVDVRSGVSASRTMAPAPSKPSTGHCPTFRQSASPVPSWSPTARSMTRPPKPVHAGLSGSRCTD